MKHLITFSLMALSVSASAQQVSTFNWLTGSSEFVDDAGESGVFKSGDALFSNHYSGYWAGGFAMSDVDNTTLPGWGNSYAAFAPHLSTYAVAYTGGVASTIVLINGAETLPLSGMHVSNTTYAALSMTQGDDFGKKFGGDSGDDPDWFLLQTIGHKNGAVVDTVDFYLADFRFGNNDDDYIIDDWTWVDLSSLGAVDSLTFLQTSSDVGDWGMNTPSYFALENFNGSAVLSTRENWLDQSVTLFPNPASDRVEIKGLIPGSDLKLINSVGAVVRTQFVDAKQVILHVSDLPAGIYHVILHQQGQLVTKSLMVK